MLGPCVDTNTTNTTAAANVNVNVNHADTNINIAISLPAAETRSFFKALLFFKDLLC